MRRLKVSASGYWFVALTIALGVVAIAANNNVLYLIESLLLSGLILSGVLSERYVSAMHVEIRRQSSTAGDATCDQITVTNRKRFTLFCVEVGEWKAGKFTTMGYLPRLGGHSTSTVISSQVLLTRGPHKWDALGVATSYPFGFAKKIRLIHGPGERIVWPTKQGSEAKKSAGAESRMGARAGIEISDGEVRAFNSDDDSRMIVWTLSARGGDPYVRMRRSESADPEVALDLRCAEGEEFEKRVSAAAKPFYGVDAKNHAGTLTLLSWEGKRRIHGRKASLNSLAMIQAGGEALQATRREAV